MSQEQPREATSAVNWAVPPGNPDPIFGTGAARAEKGLANIVGLVGAAGITALALGTNVSWNWAQYVLAAIISLDVVGGVVANGPNSAKRDHFGSLGGRPESFGMKLVRRPILFTALHLHPILIALVFAPTLWWWGAFWYLFTLAGTIAVRGSALYLQRPVALAFCALAGMAAFMTTAPGLWAWLPVLLVMKLVLAHAVQEEPYRPSKPPSSPRRPVCRPDTTGAS